jgi:AT-rich interactive domain-containing protein 1
VPQGWGAPPPHGYPHYGQQPRYPPHMMMPPGQQAQHPMPQQHGIPPAGLTSQQQQPQQPQQQASTQPPQQPGRPPMDQASYEEHQRQMIQQQQQRPSSTATSTAATPQPPPCSTAPGISEQQQQPLKTHTSIAPPTPAVATSRAPSVGVSQATSHPPPSSTSQPATSSSSAANNLPQTSVTASDGSSALANQLGQPPPMGMYPPHPSMGMYGQQRMPYPSHQGIPNGYPQQPPPQQQPNEGQNSQQQSGHQHPGMYPHISQQIYGQQMSQGWNPQMMRPPMPQGYPGMPGQVPQGQQPPPPSQQVQQPGQSSAEFWQNQQRTALAAASTQQQGQRKPFFPQNQPQPQASPQPSQRLQPQQQQHQTPNATAHQQPTPQQQPPIPPQQQKMMPASQPGPSQPLPPSQVTPQTSMHHRQMAMAGSSHQLQQSQQQHHLLQQHIPPPITFPPNSVEATAQQHLGPQRRLPKKLTKDLISATPRRIMMALKSNIHMEIVWALNALTVMLYDDTINPPTLSTEILNIIIEHFRASLSLVFPKAFSLDDVAPAEISSTNENSTSDDIWKQIIKEAKQSGETIKTKVKLPPAMKNSLGKDLNSVSRGGLQIITKEAEMPTKLKEWKDSSSLFQKKLLTKEENKEMSYEERRKFGLPTEFAYKVAESTRNFIEQSFVKSDKVKFSKWADTDIKHFEYDDEVQPKYFENQNNIDLEDYYDHEAPLDCSLVPRPIGMFLIPNTIQSYSQLCLAWSNVIRGFSFNPANEQYLVNHNGLLRLIGRLLMLYVEKGDTPKQLSRKRKQQIDEKEGKLNIEEPKETTPEEDAATKSEEEKKRAAMVSTEKDDMKSYLLEISNQLRDDAFTILSFISGSIDLFELDSEISYPIFDALIHWTVSHSVLSKDPLVPWGIICPRDFCLEIIAKMSVIDHNVDLFLSTGSPKRIEEFVRIVSDLLHMGEDTPIREFALVIMSALCQASEDICVIAALETNIVKNVISFMEAVDSKMHEVVSTKGMNELRTNPECIGTSIGMLRRAGYLLGYIVQYETCRKPFLKYMNNLINLTISHYMDTRVAIQIASIVHMAQLANIDSVSGKCLDVPDTPSVEPEILFPNKLPKFPKKDDTNDRSLPPKKEPEENNKLTGPKLNGIKRPYDDSVPSTSNSIQSLEMIVENGTSSQVNGIHQNGSHDSFKSPVRINGIHKHNKDIISPKQDVKAILRNSINHKQEAAAGPTSSKRAKLEVNGAPTNGRINGISPSTTSNGPTSTATSSSSSMAIVT